MKKIKLYITAFLAVALFAVGCDKGFDDINTDKINLTSLNPAFILNSSILNVTERNARAYMTQTHTTIQWLVCPFGSDLLGANFNQWSPKQDNPWGEFYPNAVPRISEVVRNTKDDPIRQNLYNAARIWKVYIFQQLTDTYGDVPYFEAGLGYLEGITTPIYNIQKDIYMDFLKELDEASAALDPAGLAINGEILYGGNVARWKRFGYSMLLRTAMRLSKIDPATAETYTKKAVAGGLMQSNDDNAWIRHTTEFTNRLGVEYSGTERGNYYMQQTFVERLRAKNDPRLRSFARRYVGATTFAQQTTDRATKDPDKQIGMPLGYDNLTINYPDVLSQYGVVNLYDYSQFDWSLFFVNTSPEFHCTYGQTQLLLAEAIRRGWVAGTDADAAKAYENAVRANMTLLAQFNSAAAVPAADIDTYVAANPLDVSSLEASLKQINEEYWIASIPNALEGWSNWRRTGYPELKPNPYPSSEIPGEFIRRHRYPLREEITNKDNYEAAIKRQFPQGGDQMNFRVWWDKQ